jgi:UDP-GlcNAc:undecaprenyl-phosphate GlcNAc-1-phosphate transferase
MGTFQVSRLVILIFAVVLSLVSVPVVKLFAQKFNVWSIIDFRRQSKGPVPLFGGVAIALTFGIGSAICHSSIGIKLFLCAVPFLIISILDDVAELSARLKLIGQTVSAALWIAFQQPGSMILEQLGFDPVVSKVITLIWILGITNGFNLIDGMDGIVAGSTVIFAFFLTLMGQPELGPVMILLAGAMFGFLLYNFPPARIYLGDSGSTLAGFILSCSCSIMKISFKSRADLLVPLLLLSLPLLDTFLAAGRRLLRGKSIFIGDKDHLHHRLQRLGLTDVECLAIIYAVCFYTGFSAFQMWSHSNSDKLMILFLAATPLAGIAGLVYFAENKISKLAKGERRLMPERRQELKIVPDKIKKTG